jgi:hypothetical protein
VTTTVRVHYIDPPGEKGMITRVILDVLGTELPGERFGGSLSLTTATFERIFGTAPQVGAGYTLTTVPAAPLPAEQD